MGQNERAKSCIQQKKGPEKNVNDDQFLLNCYNRLFVGAFSVRLLSNQTPFQCDCQRIIYMAPILSPIFLGVLNKRYCTYNWLSSLVLVGRITEQWSNGHKLSPTIIIFISMAFHKTICLHASNECIGPSHLINLASL